MKVNVVMNKNKRIFIQVYCDVLCNQIEKKLFQLKTCRNLGGTNFNIDEPERASCKIKLLYSQQLLIDLAYLEFNISSTALLAITTIFTKNPFFLNT